MTFDREKLVSTIYIAINIVSFHSPAMAIINMIIWGYILPRRIAGESRLTPAGVMAQQVLIY